MPRESTIQKNIIKYLNGLDGCKAINQHGGIYAEIGTPDILGCYHGQMIAVEVKQPGQKPRGIQALRMREWEEAGARVMLATSVDDVKRHLEKTPQRDAEGVATFHHFPI